MLSARSHERDKIQALDVGADDYLTKPFALDVLRHRVAVSYEAEAENITSENIITKVLETLPVP